MSQHSGKPLKFNCQSKILALPLLCPKQFLAIIHNNNQGAFQIGSQLATNQIYDLEITTLRHGKCRPSGQVQLK